MLIKGQAIRMLNDRLRSEKDATSDEAIAGVCQLIIDEWYWGETQDLRAHLNGMKRMIRLRGGFGNLGLEGLLSKMVILADLGIAITFEGPPYLQEGPVFEFRDKNPGPLQHAHNTPLIASPITFASLAGTYRMHPTTAAILDDVRFVIALAISSPTESDQQKDQKLETTARWIHDRIWGLPAVSPETSRQNESSTRHKAEDSGTRQTSTTTQASTSNRSSPSSVSMEPAPDYVYQSIRLAALVYTSAIVARKPLSQSCSVADFYQVWATVWRVPLSVWKSMMGIFLWIIVVITPPSRSTPHARFVKSMLTIAALVLGIENWPVSSGALKGMIMLQAKLNRHGTKLMG
ncbi:hypothetical protein JX265_002759 [Neoarthrinium moseri]|uniref:Uncharacterized protein n=1 Tax=Neoarthrinium moseri TaxID=1658444 RepID=A0A9P9WSQ3_9PEZI|nr:hypothetical protein JX265_002759 [Neoarthrinium moseri]